MPGGCALCAVLGGAVSSMFHLVLSKDRREESNQGRDVLLLLSSSQAAPEEAFPESLAVGFPEFSSLTLLPLAHPSCLSLEPLSALLQ